MRTWNRNEPQQSAVIEPLEPDAYLAEIVEVTTGPSPFGKAGEAPQERITVKWKLIDHPDRIMFTGYAPFYGHTASGSPSRWMAFIDGLAGQELIEDSFTDADLIGIRQRLVLEVIDGVNKAGAPVRKNRVAAVLGLKRGKKAPAAEARTASNPDELPF